MLISSSRLRTIFSAFFVGLFITVLAASAIAQPKASSHNVIIFVTDGLRPSAVNPQDTPTLYGMRQQGVNFVNSHSLFPTFTTANASVIATGHYIGDTGDFSNNINVGFPVKSAKNSPIPFLENDAVLREINNKFGKNYLNEGSFLESARKAGFSTAIVGKVGPALIQDITQNSGGETIIFDDNTGTDIGVPLSSEVIELLKKNNLPLATPSRGENGKSGNSTTPGSKIANVVQQKYFADVTAKVILPLFTQRKKPFVLVYWSRDPDGTQHNHGDSLNSLTPGINGPTVQAACQNVDKNLAQIRAALKELDLETGTNIFATADHGFSTISKQSKTSYAATLSYPGVPKGLLPPGFMAIDIAHALDLTLTNLDSGSIVIPAKGEFSPHNMLSKDSKKAEVLIAGNGGSDLIYLPNPETNQELAQKIVEVLLKEDYVSGLFVKDDLGSIPGTLPLSSVGLLGASRTPIPSIVINFTSFGTGCSNPAACGAVVSDHVLQQGQGMHGSFSRSDTFNNMAAVGPDFKQGFVDKAPVSNADVALTLAKVLNLKLPNRGNLVGRILNEALVKGPKNVSFESKTLESKPATNGLKTILKYQTVGKTRYFDVAGFPGRTIGL